MLIQALIGTMILVVLTYWLRPTGRIPGSSTGTSYNSGQGPFTRSQERGHSYNADPFTGRYQAPPPRTHNIINKGQMARCHNCSCFFPSSEVVNDVVQGHLLEFCSSKCRDYFLHPGS